MTLIKIYIALFLVLIVTYAANGILDLLNVITLRKENEQIKRTYNVVVEQNKMLIQMLFMKKIEKVENDREVLEVDCSKCDKHTEDGCSCYDGKSEETMIACAEDRYKNFKLKE